MPVEIALVGRLIDEIELLRAKVAAAGAKQRAESAELIRDELVCPCGSYQKLEAIPFVDGKPDRAAQSKRHALIDHHDICFFGEWAARIVEKGPRE